MALKGNSSNEAVLYVRLHLLQAICAYISGKNAEDSMILGYLSEFAKEML